MINKMKKDDNMINTFYDGDPTKTKVYALIEKLRENTHYSRKTSKDDLQKVIDLLKSAIRETEETE